MQKLIDAWFYFVQLLLLAASYVYIIGFMVFALMLAAFAWLRGDTFETQA